MSKLSKAILFNLQRLEDLEKKIGTQINKKSDHDDLLDHHDMKKKLVLSNNSLMNTFPNAILLEDLTQKKIKKKKKEIKEDAKPSIWDVLNEAKNNDSDDLEYTISDSSHSSDTNNSIQICKGCNSENSFIEDQNSSVLVCSQCGMVNEELLDHGPEWRKYNNDDNRGEGVNRCGCPSNYFFPKSSQGTIMVGPSNNRLKRKQKWNSVNYKERSLNLVFQYINQICNNHRITKNIVDSANFLYKKLSDCKHKKGVNKGKQIIIRGENRISIIAACVFKACEMNKNPRSIKEIAYMFDLEDKKVTKGIKQYERIMKNADDDTIIMAQFNTDTAEDYIRRHCPILKINNVDTAVAVKIARNCCKMKLASDHNPHSVAAGAILLMVQYRNLNVDRKSIATLFGTSDVTISKIYNKIVPYVQALIDDDLTDHIIKEFKING